MKTMTSPVSSYVNAVDEVLTVLTFLTLEIFHVPDCSLIPEVLKKVKKKFIKKS